MRLLKTITAIIFTGVGLYLVLQLSAYFLHYFNFMA